MTAAGQRSFFKTERRTAGLGAGNQIIGENNLMIGVNLIFFLCLSEDLKRQILSFDENLTEKHHILGKTNNEMFGENQKKIGKSFEKKC